MADTHTHHGKPAFRSKRRRQRQRARMHRRTVFDAARREEIKEKCLALAKTAKAAPAPKCKPLPSLKRLNQLLKVDFESGTLTARVARPRLRPGDLLGTDSGGYLQLYIDGSPYRLHRIIWKMYSGHDPKGQIDHIDGNKQNNSIANLRDVSPLENSRNRRKASDNSSGRLGVSACSRTGLWAAHIGCNDRIVNLGKYTLKADAIAARECAERVLFGITPNQREAA